MNGTVMGIGGYPAGTIDPDAPLHVAFRVFSGFRRRRRSDRRGCGLSGVRRFRSISILVGTPARSVNAFTFAAVASDVVKLAVGRAKSRIDTAKYSCQRSLEEPIPVGPFGASLRA